MIFDDKKNISKYETISVNFKKAARFILETDFSVLQDGRYEIDGSNVYCIVQTPDLKEAEDIKWEAHRNYADIQIAISSGEIIEYVPLDLLKSWEEYISAWDCIYSNDPIKGTVLKLDKDMFAVFFPWDGHKPCIKGADSDKGRKAVIKVRI